jgi:hypothetical protein
VGVVWYRDYSPLHLSILFFHDTCNIIRF